MKTFLTSFAFCIVLNLTGIAQRSITVAEGPVTFRHGNTPGITLTIPEVSFKNIQDSWIKSLEKGTKSKVQIESEELSIFGANIKEIAAAPVNVYSLVKNNDTTILLAASFELKKDVYVSAENNMEEFAKAKAYMLEFAKGHYLQLAKEQLDNEERKLSKMAGELKSLENDKVRMEKMIQSNTTTIGATNDELVIQRTNLLSLNDELLSQTNQYNALEEGPAKDEKKKYIDDLEKRIKKTNKEVESGEKKIVDMQAEIDKAQNDLLPANIKNQEQLRKTVDEQQEVVKGYQAKYNGIKDFK